MEIEIVGDSIGEATVDLNKFKAVLGKTWNLKAAVMDSTKINMCRLQNEIDFLKCVWLTLNWGKLMNVFDKTKDKEMNVKAYAVRYKGWPMFSPKVTDGRKFEIDVEEKEGTDIMLVQSLCKDMSFNLKNFIDNTQFRYGYPPKKWGVDLSGLLGNKEDDNNENVQ